MTYIPDLSPETYNKYEDDAYIYLAVGWLGGEVRSKGDTAPEILDALLAAKKNNKMSDDWFGYHACEICNAYDDLDEFFVPDGATKYVLPNMVIHYIQSHGYRLPKVVEMALLNGECTSLLYLEYYPARIQANLLSDDNQTRKNNANNAFIGM